MEPPLNFGFWFWLFYSQSDFLIYQLLFVGCSLSFKIIISIAFNFGLLVLEVIIYMRIPLGRQILNYGLYSFIALLPPNQRPHDWVVRKLILARALPLYSSTQHFVEYVSSVVALEF